MPGLHITNICRLLKVSRSCYYASVEHLPGPRAIRCDKTPSSVRRAFDDNHAAYGSWKVAQELAQRNVLESACRNTVAQVMRDLGLKSRVSKRFKPTTTQADPWKRPAMNVLDRKYTAEAPSQKWITDITYLPTYNGWVYLAVVIDQFSHKVVGCR